MRALLLCLSMIAALSAVASAGPLHEAAESGDTAGIEAALAAGANVDEPDKSATPLFYAVQRGHLEAAKLLIERGADINAASGLGPSVTVAALKGDPQFIELLLAHGADPNTAKGSQTLLHMVVESGCLDCVRMLVEAGADVNAQWVKGAPDNNPAILTPYHMAKRGEHAEIAEYLLAHGVVTPPRPDPISAELAAADAAKGEAFFMATCRNCHLATPRDEHGLGPNLWNLVGRAKASSNFDRYSPTLTAWGGTWTYEELNVFLAGPSLTVPGVFMEVRAAPIRADRANLIAYLRTLSDAPVPLP